MPEENINDLDTENLNKLLAYWINHNDQHANEMEKWINKLQKSISKEDFQDLIEVIHLLNNISKRFKLIKDRLEQGKKKSLKKNIGRKNELFIKWEKDVKNIKFKELGFIHTPYKENAPYQPVEKDEGEFQIILRPEYKEGLRELEKFNYLFIIYHIHRISRERGNIVSPPWTEGYKVGIFASRSPLRPNPIGISIVKIKKIENNVIFTSGLDVFDGTPLLDIKPYIKDLDSKEDSNYGWIEDLDQYEHLLLHIKGIPHDY